jgi:hypothetical protein
MTGGEECVVVGCSLLAAVKRGECTTMKRAAELEFTRNTTKAMKA